MNVYIFCKCDNIWAAQIAATMISEPQIQSDALKGAAFDARGELAVKHTEELFQDGTVNKRLEDEEDMPHSFSIEPTLGALSRSSRSLRMAR